MYSKKNLILIALILLNLLAKAQIIEVSGKITDNRKGESVPFANIQLKNSKYGTISNDSGYFSLKIPYKLIKNKLIFSCIGYETKELLLENATKKLNILLNPIDFMLGQVIIMPDSTLLTLLKKAYKKIPDNYPTYPTKLKGFYRESIKNSQNKYLYFAEAVTETYKSSYDISTDNGQVKILKSLVNEFPELNSLKGRIFGGVFTANEGDIVKKRADFINPRHFNEYSYSLAGISELNGNEVYIISFDTKNDSLDGTKKGKFYIEKLSLAYIGFEYENTKRGLNKNDNENLRRVSSSEAKKNAYYFKYNNKWHIKYIAHSWTFKLAHPETYEFNDEYIANEIYIDSVKPIPLAERVEFGDIFSEKAKSYNSDDYWGEYNILKKDSSLDNQLKSLYDTTESKKILTQKTGYKNRKNLLKILPKVGFEYGLSYYPFHADNGLYSINYENNNIISLNEELSSFQYNINLLAQISYSLNYRWFIDFATSNSLNKKRKLNTYDLGASYRILLKKRSKPLFLNLGLLFSYYSFSRNFSTYQNNTKFEFANKTIDAKKLHFGIGCNTIALKPKMSLEYNLIRRLYLRVSAAYYLPFYTSERLYLKEKSGFFLTRKSASLPLTDNSLNISYNGENTTNSPITFKNYSFDIGFILKF